MLHRAQRLHTARQYQELWRNGRVQRGRFMVVRLREAVGPVPRFGFVVSTAVAKKATDRNLIKRRLRSAARELSPTTHADAVVYATKNTLTATYAALVSDLRHALASQKYAPTPRLNH